MDASAKGPDSVLWGSGTERSLKAFGIILRLATDAISKWHQSIHHSIVQMHSAQQIYFSITATRATLRHGPDRRVNNQEPYPGPTPVAES